MAFMEKWGKPRAMDQHETFDNNDKLCVLGRDMAGDIGPDNDCPLDAEHHDAVSEGGNAAGDADVELDPQRAMLAAISDAEVAEAGNGGNAEIVEPIDWWNNPYLVPNAKGTDYLAPNVPACAWWIEHPESGLSHVRYNSLTGFIEAELLPWNVEPHIWSDADVSFLFCQMQEMTNSLIKTTGNLMHALVVVAHRRKHDPLKDMLDTLPPWDGRPRAETLLIDFLGAADTPYTRAITAHMLKGAVMRAYVPGIKFDECVVLVSQAEGIGKSTMLNKLAMSDEFFTDTLGNIDTKDASENIRGKWIIEIAELDALRKRDPEAVRAFVSRRIDRYRDSYGKFSQDRPRRCIFAATSNSTSFLDESQNRRFLCVLCNVTKPKKSVFRDLSEEYVQQVWAEILQQRDENGGTLPLVLPEDMVSEAEQQRDVFRNENTIEGIALAWIERHVMPGARVCTVLVSECAFHVMREDSSTPRARKLQRELQQLFDRSPCFVRIKGRPLFSDEYGQQRQWRYEPPSG